MSNVVFSKTLERVEEKKNWKNVELVRTVNPEEIKRWKSQDLVATLTGSTDVRQMVGVWARLLAAVVQHWLVIGSVWGDPTKSRSKVCQAIRAFVGRLAAALDRLTEMERVLADLCAVVAKTCRRNKRSKPGTFELLNNVDLLDFRLT